MFIQADLHSQQELGRKLAAGKWRPVVESLKDPFERNFTALLLESQERFMELMSEDVRIQSIGSYEKFVFPIIRAVYPNLIAKDIVSVQPMTGPTSLVFYLDAIYGTDKGSIQAGDTMFSARKGHLYDDQYSSEAVIGEQLAGTVTKVSTGVLGFKSARPNTVTITQGAIVATDNGVGGLAGSGVTSGTINYTTGAYTITYDADPGDGTKPVANYYYNSEGSDQVPIVDFELSSTPVTATPQKLRGRWSVEAATNLKAVHGMDAETELVALLSEKIRWDIDRRIISDLFSIAAAGTVYWNKPAPAAVSFNDHKQTFIDTLIEASNLIFRSTRRGTGNFVVCGTNVSTVVESLYGFRPQAVAGNGVVFSGTLNGRWSMYKDPYMDPDKFLVGWKGTSFLEAGYVYAPYVPLYMTPTYTLDDMLNRKGIMTQYGVKSVNGLYYATGEITYET